MDVSTPPFYGLRCATAYLVTKRRRWFFFSIAPAEMTPEERHPGRGALLGERRAARRLPRLRLHQLRPRQIRIVEIQLPLPIAPDLRRLSVQVYAARGQLLLCLRHARHAQRQMVHHTQR